MATANIYIKDKLITEIALDELLAQIQKPKFNSFFGIVRGPHSEKGAKEAQEMLESHRRFTLDCGLSVIEMPNISTDKLQATKAAISKSDYTYACFLDVLATGLVAIVNSGDSPFDEVITPLTAYFEKLTGLPIDKALVGSKCYMTYDPNLYLNADCKVFQACNTAKEVNSMLDLMSDLAPLEIQKSATVPVKEQTAANSEEHQAEKTIAASIPGLPAGLTVLFDTPTIPDEVFDVLPSLLREACAIFKDKRERDVFLTGAIIVIGACIEGVYGLYDNKKAYPNLYAFIVAPAANGKGVMDYSLKLGQGVDRKYQLQGQGSAKTLFIPGNISASMVIQMLNASNGKGIFYETEADTLVNSLMKEWGNFSDVLRKAFHSERISQARVGNLQFDIIEEPRLSMLLSGTPEQVKGLIPSTENGLFSRMAFYAYQKAVRFKDVRPNTEVNYVDLFDSLSGKIVAMEELLSANPSRFEFTSTQWDRFQQIYDGVLGELSDFVTTDLDGTVLRIGSIHFRISMILSALRKANAMSTESTIICSDTDFETGAKLASTYLEHAKIVYGLIRKAKGTVQLSAKQKFLNALPTGEFSRQKAVEVAMTLKIGERSVGDYLKELSDSGFLDKPSHGMYKKAV